MDPPVFDGVGDDGFLPDVGPIEAEADETPVQLTPPSVTDAIDGNPTVTFSPAQDEVPPVFPLLDKAEPPNATEIQWTATDFAGNLSTAKQRIFIVDTTNPVVTVSFPDGSSQTTSSLNGKAVTFVVDVNDIFQPPFTCETAPGVPIDSGDLFPVGDTTVTCTATDTWGNNGSGSATVTVAFEYLASGISGKTSGKTGSSFPFTWAWTDDSGTPQTVSDQRLSIEPGACPGDGLDAQDPGKSGLRQDTGGSYIYNLQAVDPSTQEPWVISQNSGDPFCFTVSLPTGESQFIGLTIRP
jgi:hypothetical protein